VPPPPEPDPPPPPEPDPPPDPPLLGGDETGGDVVGGAAVVVAGALCVTVEVGGAATCFGLGRGRSPGSAYEVDGSAMAGPDAAGMYSAVGIGDPDDELEALALPIRSAMANRTTTSAASSARRAGDWGARADVGAVVSDMS
jgi:hypothetical protein